MDIRSENDFKEELLEDAEDDRTSDQNLEQSPRLEDVEDVTEPEEMRKLFIGGLDYRTTDHGLRLYFERFGDLVDVVVMKDPKTKRSRGFGFVAYSKAFMADEAQTNGPHKIDGRTVEIKRVIPRNEMNSPEGGGTVGGLRNNIDDEDITEPEEMRKLFIGGLDYSTTDEGLKEYFERFGKIVDVVVIKDPNTKKSRGFGFVAFSKACMLDEAQKSRPHKIDGRTVETKRVVVPRNDMNGREAGGTVKKLFVGGLKDDVTEDDIREEFCQFGTIVEIFIPTEKDTQKNRGFAFVKFDDYDSVDRACLKKDISVKNKWVDVKKAISKNNMIMQQGNQDRRGTNSSGGSPWAGRNENNWGNNQNVGGQGDNRGPWGNQGNYGGIGGPGGFNQSGFNNAGPPWQGGPSNNAGPPWQGGPSNQGWGNNTGNYGGNGNNWNRGSNFGNNYGQSYGGGPVRSQNYGQTKRSTPYKTGSPMGGYNAGGGGDSDDDDYYRGGSKPNKRY